MKLTYGDEIRIKGEKRIRKVLFEENGWVYFGSFGDKIKKETGIDMTEEFNKII